MKRFLRWLLNGLTILSLLLSLAAAGLWVRSRGKSELLEHLLPDHYTYYWSNRGRFLVVVTRQPVHDVGGWLYIDYPVSRRLIYDDPSASAGDFWYSLGGVILGKSQSRGQTWLSIPYWLIIVVTALLPTMRLMRRLIHRRPAAGHCAACGYDLQASPERCPECGLVPALVPSRMRKP